MAKKNEVVASNGLDDYFTQVISNRHVFYVDEPVKAGGKDKEPSPTDYVLGALASCTAITMRMYAQRKEWDVGKIKVHATLSSVMTGDGVRQKIWKEVVFEKELPKAQEDRLIEIGEKCPVSLMLKHNVEMTLEKVDQLDEGITKEYTREGTTVVWKPNRCIHSEKCWRGLYSVFNPKKHPWVNMDGAPVEKIVEQVGKCPSGALSIKDEV
ncbi:(4Fe-4S)-binding protein [Sinomicrobium kalidii]|uniref:(4Fe-4S)-binding protein n=1 Tax=Sinomicrobium kalidii TaxID=2900738 RepID=UPI001E5C68FB|nr:(4Fe-4S)-binding protein [Sinomicrobium kalidii]UGU16940.1 (4Fe-4S)-binding protein [Sinomicrobium kalidii]